MKSIVYVVLLLVAIFTFTYGSPVPDEQSQVEPETLLANLESNKEDSKPFNLQSFQSGRRAHGIYFNGRR